MGVILLSWRSCLFGLLKGLVPSIKVELLIGRVLVPDISVGMSEDLESVGK